MAAALDGNRLVALSQSELDDMLERAAQKGAERVLAASSATAAASTARRLVKRREAATALAVSQATFDRLRRRGLPEVRVGASSRFDVDACRRWLDEHSKNSTGNAGESNEQR